MSLSDCVQEVRLELEELGAHGGSPPYEGCVSVQKCVGLLEAAQEVLRRAAHQLDGSGQRAKS